MAIHTRGPWVVGDMFNNMLPVDAPITSTGYDESMEICLVTDQDEHNIQVANARLVATAPELLDAVEHVLIAYEDGGTTDDIDWNMLRSVYNKAKKGN